MFQNKRAEQQKNDALSTLSDAEREDFLELKSEKVNNYAGCGRLCEFSGRVVADFVADFSA
jgi:hypothetical protein